MKTSNDLQHFFETLLKELVWSERHLVKVLETMKTKATSKALKEAFKKHELHTKKQGERLEKIFGLLELGLTEEKSLGMQGLFDEGWKLIDQTEDSTYRRDVALIIAAQKVEHYEIATYGSLIALADLMGQKKVVQLLKQSLEEEKLADAELTELARLRINEPAKTESNPVRARTSAAKKTASKKTVAPKAKADS